MCFIHWMNGNSETAYTFVLSKCYPAKFMSSTECYCASDQGRQKITRSFYRINLSSCILFRKGDDFSEASHCVVSMYCTSAGHHAAAKSCHGTCSGCRLEHPVDWEQVDKRKTGQNCSFCTCKYAAPTMELFFNHRIHSANLHVCNQLFIRIRACPWIGTYQQYFPVWIFRNKFEKCIGDLDALRKSG